LCTAYSTPFLNWDFSGFQIKIPSFNSFICESSHLSSSCDDSTIMNIIICDSIKCILGVLFL
jgi:hypothetical protein